MENTTPMSEMDKTWLKIARANPEQFRKVYSCHQASEIIERTRRVMNRIFPKIPTPHGFYNRGEFFESLEIAGRRRDICRKVQERIGAKVQKRDANLTIEQLVKRFNSNGQKRSNKTANLS